jgi:hypothetical protein
MKDLGFGTVEYQGKELRLTQEPYIDTDIINDVEYYRALAEDAGEKEYEVRWETKEYEVRWEMLDDPADDCDWDSYTVKCLGEKI